MIEAGGASSVVEYGSLPVGLTTPPSSVFGE